MEGFLIPMDIVLSLTILSIAIIMADIMEAGMEVVTMEEAIWVAFTILTFMAHTIIHFILLMAITQELVIVMVQIQLLMEEGRDKAIFHRDGTVWLVQDRQEEIHIFQQVEVQM